MYIHIIEKPHMHTTLIPHYLENRLDEPGGKTIIGCFVPL